MEVKATNNTGWRIRLGAMAGIFVFVAAYFLYDGFVGYPRDREIYTQFAAFEKDYTQKHGEASDWIGAWNKQALAKGLPEAESPHSFSSFHHSDSAILTQKVIGFAMLPLAGLLAFAWVRTFTNSISMDEKGLTTPKGNAVPFDAITKLDKTKWYKCIAKVYYSESEQDMMLVLDDWKYDRDAIDQIVRAIEQRLTDEQIVGDIRETERDKKKAQKQAEAQQAEAQQGEQANADAGEAEAGPATPTEPSDEAPTVQEDEADAVSEPAEAESTAKRSA